MHALEIGSIVRTASGFEPVVGFLHAEDRKAAFVEITHPTGMLAVTPDHLVFLANGDAVTASSIKVGDSLSSSTLR